MKQPWPPSLNVCDNHDDDDDSDNHDDAEDNIKAVIARELSELVRHPGFCLLCCSYSAAVRPTFPSLNNVCDNFSQQ